MAKSIYITRSGILAREKDNIVLRREGERPQFGSIENISEVYVLTDVTIKTRLLAMLSDKGIPIHFFNRRGYVGSFMPPFSHASPHVFILQVEHYRDPAKRLVIAREMVRGMLKGIDKAIDRWVRLKGLPATHKKRLSRLFEALEGARDVPRLLAVEGEARKMYFDAMAKIYPQFGGRSRRPPGDEFNALLSYGYGLLYASVLTAIYQTSLDPKVSYVHEPHHHTYPLRLDIADLFKVPFVDRLVTELYDRGQLKASWFDRVEGGVFLSARGRRGLIKAWEELMRSSVTVSRHGRKMSLRRLLRLECQKLVRHLISQKPYRAYGGR